MLLLGFAGELRDQGLALNLALFGIVLVTNTAIGLEASYDWIRYTIDRPMMAEPGTRFNYNSGASELLAAP